jgi:preprotein translocase subunit SecG
MLEKAEGMSNKVNAILFIVFFLCFCIYLLMLLKKVKYILPEASFGTSTEMIFFG